MGHLLKIKSSVFMEVCLLPSILSSTFVLSIAFKKFHTKVLCVIFFGLIQMIVVVGAFLLVVLVTRLAKTFRSNSTTTTVSRWLHVLISSSWKATIGVTNRML